MKAKKIYTAAALVLLLALYMMIFFFSSEDAESSSDVSVRVTNFLLGIYYRLKGSSGVPPIGNYAVLSAEGVVRKLAHFTEYMAVGLLSYSIVVLWHGTIKKGCLFVTMQLLLSAALDEFHQYFVPGRYASIKDVLIDTAGGIVGMFLVFLMYKWYSLWHGGSR